MTIIIDPVGYKRCVDRTARCFATHNPLGLTTPAGRPFGVKKLCQVYHHAYTVIHDGFGLLGPLTTAEDLGQRMRAVLAFAVGDARARHYGHDITRLETADTFVCPLDRAVLPALAEVLGDIHGVADAGRAVAAFDDWDDIMACQVAALRKGLSRGAARGGARG